MKKKFILILLVIFALPVKVFASGGFNVSSSSISMYPGEAKTITISSFNAVGKLNIFSGNGSVASVGPGSVFIQNPGSSASITITGNNVGNTTISVVASDDFATMDEELLSGQTKTISVNVIERPAPPSSDNNTNNNNSNNNTNNNNNNSNNSNNKKNNSDDNKSNNSNLKELSVDGYKLEKVDDNNYTLSVLNDISNINIKAQAEDSKANITGIGNHELKIGENNIEIIVTSEAGTQNKINIKVIRKDGYYLEDLDKVLNDNKIKDINIIIKNDSKIDSSNLEKIKKSKKTVNLNYFNEEKKLIYSFIIDGKKIKKCNDLLLNIIYSFDSKNKMMKLSNYADGIFLNIKDIKNISDAVKIKLYVGDKYNNKDLVNVYSYVNSNKTLGLLEKKVKVTDGYVLFRLDKSDNYLITMSTILDSLEIKKNTSYVLPIIIITSIITGGVIFFIFKKMFVIKRRKHEK